RTAQVLGHAAPGWWLASVAIIVGSVWPMAWRWQRLLAARGVHDSLGWLVRAYFVGYAAGQILPTSLGGDASRIYEPARRHERPAPRLDVRAHARRAGRTRARDLVRRQGGRRRALAPPVLRDGTAALPRHARAVHGERTGGARVVLRLLPRRARDLRRPRV